MIFIYIITLLTSAGLTGLFIRQAMTEQGYVPGFNSGLMLAGGVALVYVGAQLLYVALIRTIWPTRTNSPLLAESLSHAATLLFIPSLLRVDVAWPHPMMKQAEPLVYLGLFLVALLVLKLFSFYAVLRSDPGPRLWNLVWAAVSAVSLAIGASMFTTWLGSIDEARPRAPDAVNAYRIGTSYAAARALPEGSVLTLDVDATLGNSLAFACAPLPGDELSEEALDMAYVTVEMRGEKTMQYTSATKLSPDGWSHVSVPLAQIPSGLKSCQVRWAAVKESKWRKAIGILPIVASDKTLLLSGPFSYDTNADASSPNLIVIVVDGLGSDRVTSAGYKRPTTPNLDNLAKASLAFPMTYAPAPEAAAACMTLLTGVSPLRHGYLGPQRGPLPEENVMLSQALRAKRYVTAAFTEGEMWGDLTFGSGFERGFDLFDDGYQAESVAPADVVATTAPGATSAGVSRAAGSQETLLRVQQWIDAHQDLRFMVFVRLSELRDARVRERYGRGFVPDPSSATPTNIYDTVILHLDRCIGDFLQHVKDLPAGKQTTILVTSTRGSYLPTNEPLDDWTLRVPTFLSNSGTTPAKRTELVGTEDIASTVAKLAQVNLSPYASTADLVNAPVSREPISMTGNPLILTIRNKTMRLNWSTQRAPFTLTSAGPSAAASLYNLERMRGGTKPVDIAARNPQMVSRWTEKLEQYFTMQSEGWATKPVAAN